jgi:alkylation response protein AidB-like acyl-CoA dehydrogenase
MSVAAVDVHEELGATVRQFLAEHASLEQTLRRLEEPLGYDQAVWRRMASDMELPGLAVPERLGGQGFGVLEQAVVLEEFGRLLYSGPYLASAVLVPALLSASGDTVAQDRWLPAVGAGTTVAAAAICEQTLDWHTSDTVHTTAEVADGTCVLDGTKIAVIAGDTAGPLIVLARENRTGALRLVAVDTDTPGVEVIPEPVLDLTRRLTRVRFTRAHATPISSVRPVSEVIARAQDVASVAMACEQIGAARGSLELTLDYARRRVQFGREIGSFQAVRHRLADLHAGIECAAAAVHYAVRLVDAEAADLTVPATTARSVASNASRDAAESMVQLHGWIGFTWEHPAHLYLKRAKSAELLLGHPELHRSRLHLALHGW